MGVKLKWVQCGYDRQNFYGKIVTWVAFYVPYSVSWLLAVFLVLSWPIVISLSGLWQARGLRTDAGVTWPCLERDPEVEWK